MKSDKPIVYARNKFHAAQLKAQYGRKALIQINPSMFEIAGQEIEQPKEPLFVAPHPTKSGILLVYPHSRRDYYEVSRNDMARGIIKYLALINKSSYIMPSDEFKLEE